MKYLKVFGLAAVVAAVAMAFVASTASATALCSANEEECASPFGTGTAVEASLKTGTTAMLKTELATVLCSKSATSGKTTSGPGASVTGVIESLSFSECKTHAGTNCTVGTALSLPYNASITATGSGNGKLTVTKGSGGGNPGATVTCLGVIECTFRTPSATLNVLGGNPAVAKAEAIELTERSGLLCPSKEAKWTAEYAVSKPNPLWISEAP